MFLLNMFLRTEILSIGGGHILSSRYRGLYIAPERVSFQGFAPDPTQLAQDNKTRPYSSK